MQNIQTDAPDWLLPFAAAATCWHTGTATGTVSTSLADEPIVSLYNCSSHGRFFRHVVERLVDCCIQEIDGIGWYDDQNGKGLPWTHHQISDDASADGFSLGACLSTAAMMMSQSVASFWMSWVINSHYSTSLDHVENDRASGSPDSSTLIQDICEKTLLPRDA